MGAIRKRGKRYVIDYYDATGKRRWETIGPNLHEAKQVLPSGNGSGARASSG